MHRILEGGRPSFYGIFGLFLMTLSDSAHGLWWLGGGLALGATFAAVSFAVERRNPSVGVKLNRWWPYLTTLLYGAAVLVHDSRVVWFGFGMVAVSIVDRLIVTLLKRSALQ